MKTYKYYDPNTGQWAALAHGPRGDKRLEIELQTLRLIQGRIGEVSTGPDRAGTLN